MAINAPKCASCVYFSAKVVGPDGPHAGKCFVDYEKERKVAWVDADFWCERYEEYQDVVEG